jgi:hypothetical protein
MLAGGGGAWLLQRVKRQAATEVAGAREVAKNMMSAKQWFDFNARLLQISTWLTDSANSRPAGGRGRVQLNAHDRDRLRQAMLDEVLTGDKYRPGVEKAEPLPLEPDLTIALMIELATRQVVAAIHGEFDRPAQGIPHLERALAIYNYLDSPESGMSAVVKRVQPQPAALARVELLDFRERAGAVESMETQLAETEQAFVGVRELRGEQQALSGIRGALLGRRGDFATGERLLLARHAALTRPDNPAEEFLPRERRATVRRLVNLYTAWGRPDEAARWAGQLPGELAPK